MKIIKYLTMTISIIGLILLAVGEIKNLTILINLPAGINGLLIHIFEWSGFISLLLLGCLNLYKYRNTFNIFASISFLSFIIAIILVLTTLAQPLIYVIGYAIPCGLSATYIGILLTK